VYSINASRSGSRTNVDGSEIGGVLAVSDLIKIPGLDLEKLNPAVCGVCHSGSKG